MPDAALARLVSLSSIVAIAHRGGAALRPENTWTAFEHAASLGADAIECDVHLSRDGEVVVIHDETLERTTDLTGRVADRSADELARADAAYRFDPVGGYPLRGRGVGVPRLAEVLRRLPGMPFVIEIKGERPAVCGPVLDVIRGAGALDRVIVGGFSDAVLRRVRGLEPRLITSASAPEARAALRRSYFRIAPRRSGFALFQVPIRLRGRQLLTRAFVRCARRAGLPVQVWVVDDPDEMRSLLDWGVTGLISDRPDVAVRVARSAAGRAA